MAKNQDFRNDVDDSHNLHYDNIEDGCVWYK